MTSNLKTAQLLNRVAAVFRVMEGDTFRVKAYNNAATSIENLGQPLEELWQNQSLDTVPGLGDKLRGYLDEYFTNGKVRHFEALFKNVPAGMFALMEVRSIGPITAYKIAKKFKLNNPDTALSDLKKILDDGQLTKISSFKEKTASRIEKALESQKSNPGRILLSEAIDIAEDFITYIKQTPYVIDAEPLGSLRRHLPTIGDIDLGVSTVDPEKAIEHILGYPDIETVVSSGEKVSRVRLNNNLEVDIKVTDPDNWGSLLQHYTGSKLHNIKLRNLALKNGMSLSEYGITVDKRILHFRNEKLFYKYLGLQFIPPEIREDNGEIELAQANILPRLVDLTNIKGDLHIHSNYQYPSSHDLGVSHLGDILDEAYQRNYEYLGIADHNPKFTGLTETQKKKIILDRKKYLEGALHEYENSVKNRGIKLLYGMEVDIRVDGSLALSDELLDLLDYAIVSIHSSFEMTLEVNTRRIICGLSHPKAIILGHPTGQLINKRDQILVNWDEIFAYCAKNKKLVEINASPERLDLPDDLIKKAISYGLKLIVNTDSHHVDQMDFIKYGVWQARRGFATKKNIINSFSLPDLLSVLK